MVNAHFIFLFIQFLLPGGTYGPAPPVGKDVWELQGALTKMPKLLACGDGKRSSHFD